MGWKPLESLPLTHAVRNPFSSKRSKPSWRKGPIFEESFGLCNVCESHRPVCPNQAISHLGLTTMEANMQRVITALWILGLLFISAESSAVGTCRKCMEGCEELCVPKSNDCADTQKAVDDAQIAYD